MQRRLVMVQNTDRKIYSKELVYDYNKNNFGGENIKCIIKHCHAALELIYVLEGSMYVEFGQYSGIAVSGELLFINPFDVHYAYVNAEHPYVRYIFVNMELTGIQTMIVENNRSAIDDLIAQRRFFVAKLDDPALTATTARLMSGCAEYYNKSLEYPPASYFLLSAATALIGELLTFDCFDKPSSHDMRYRCFMNRINDFVENNFNREISHDELPALFSWTQSHFCRIFKKCYGTSFSSYLRNYRVEKALNIMIHMRGESRLDSVATECGFSDYSYFCRVFREAYGILPREYIRRIREASISD